MSVFEFQGKNHAYRDMFADGVFHRQLWVKGRKEWKDKFIISKDGVMNISPQGKLSRMYVHDNGTWVAHETFEADHRIQGNSIAFQEFLEYIDPIIPSFKYWVKKSQEMGHIHAGVLDVMMLNRDIPEAESMMILHKYHKRIWDVGALRYSRNTVFTGRWEIAELLTKATWRKMPKYMRVRLVNEYRRWCEEYYDNDNLLKGDMKRVLDILLHRHEPNFIVEGHKNPRTGVTNRDIEWLKSIRPETTGYDISCYHDWLCYMEDRVTDITDPYFRHNARWMEQHRQMVTEHEEAIARADEARKAQRVKDIEDFEERYKKYTNVLEEDGWRIYISNDFNAWRARAYALRQCIVSSEYYAKKDEVLIFVDKGKEPRYTCEVFLEDKSIGQFYGNESRDSKDLRPSDDVRELTKKYIEMYL